MALIRSRSRPKDSIPSSSMADIAFLLLVFFLVTTVFPKDRGLALALPQTEARVNEANVLHLIVRSTGYVGIRRGESQETQTVRAEAVSRVWREEAARNPRLIALVRTEPEAAYSRMIDVLDRLYVAGATRVSLQVEQD